MANILNNDKTNIFYKPDLHPERNYYSEDTFIRDIKDIIVPDVNLETPIEEANKIIKDLKQIKTLVGILPKEVRFLDKVLDKLVKRMEVAIINKEIIHIPNPPIEKPDEVQKKPGDNDIKSILDHIGVVLYPKNTMTPDKISLFPDSTNISISITPPRNNVQIAINEYSKNTLELQKYYVTSMQIALQTYFNQMFQIMANANVSDIETLTDEFDPSAVNVNDQNLQHLKDYITRSQIQRNQKSRLFQKTHNVDQVMLNMRNWHAAEKQKEKYYQEQYKADTSKYLDNESNDLLRTSRQGYDKAYSNALYNMFKYLDSSVEITNEILDMTVNESKAKAALAEAGVDFTAKTPVKEEKVNEEDYKVQSWSSNGSDTQPAQDNNDRTNGSASDTSENNSSGGTGSANNDIIEKALQWCIGIANDNSTQHLYSQADRDGPNYDCTSLVCHGLMNAGLNLPYAFGGDSFNSDLCQYGFEELAYPGESGLQRGDILSNSHHVAFYLGGGQMVHARSAKYQADEQIAVTNFYEDWDSILRYKG